MKKAILALVTCAALLVGCEGRSANVEVEDPNTQSSEAISVEESNVQSSEEASVETSTEDNQNKEYLEGYAKYLEEHTDLWEMETVYVLDYINDDDVPDLIFGDTMANHASNIYILTYLDGNYDEVVCCGPFGAYGATCYYPRRGIMLTTDYAMGYDTEYYSRLSADGEYGFETVCNRYFYFEEDDQEEPSEIKFYITSIVDREISQEEYDEYVKELVGDTEQKVFYTYENENGYEYLNQEAIDNLFGDV